MDYPPTIGRTIVWVKGPDPDNPGQAPNWQGRLTVFDAAHGAPLTTVAAHHSQVRRAARRDSRQPLPDLMEREPRRSQKRLEDLRRQATASLAISTFETA